ncbi:unnamed protein product [Pleuronectes platessa]|uniref:Uncharacterized protein n=1 Tax=Pleuronectes platessa TaxID=8262 RepID=A0A9N7V5I0_PLEPL|nr:unnamed protein product [Pleuronectes platessa]
MRSQLSCRYRPQSRRERKVQLESAVCRTDSEPEATKSWNQPLTAAIPARAHLTDPPEAAEQLLLTDLSTSYHIPCSDTPVKMG